MLSRYLGLETIQTTEIRSYKIYYFGRIIYKFSWLISKVEKKCILFWPLNLIFIVIIISIIIISL